MRDAQTENEARLMARDPVEQFALQNSEIDAWIADHPRASEM